jgi:outer membrane biosynthesis protein TonB
MAQKKTTQKTSPKKQVAKKATTSKKAAPKKSSPKPAPAKKAAAAKAAPKKKPAAAIAVEFDDELITLADPVKEEAVRIFFDEVDDVVEKINLAFASEVKKKKSWIRKILRLK